MPQYLTAAKLYDYTRCPHRVWRDIYGPQEEKIIETNPFVQLLWDRGIAHEQAVVSRLGKFADLGAGTHEQRFRDTIEAMKNGEPLIYQGVLIHENMLGIPDFLRLAPEGQYVPIEIKSGMGYEGVNEDEGEQGKPKKHYAVQLALYVELLNKLGFENRRIGKVIDSSANEFDYDLTLSVGKNDRRSLWDYYEQVKNNVHLLITNQAQNKPALAGSCKLCPWYQSCKKWVNENGDLTKIFYLGRSRRDRINEDLGIYAIGDILNVDVKEAMRQKKKGSQFLHGIGEKTLEEILRRTEVLVNSQKPVVYTKIEFPKVKYELYFDIEDDPTQEFVYMHGVYVKGPDGEEYKDFTATEINTKAEKRAWQEFWDFIRSLPQDDYAVYYYSHHEKTTYRRMRKLYPDVISENDLEAFFANPNVIDLYDVVKRHTDWPVSSYSLKDLAQYLGFNWQDKTPSGALSIQWFNEFIQTGDEKMLKRLLVYNKDDCKATMVLKEGIEKLAGSSK
jgi:predicted RecB family nuclease